MLFLVVILIVSFSLFGCKEEATPTEEVAEETSTETTEEVKAPEEEVTLDLWFQDWEGGANWTRDWVEVFEEKYPKINKR